MFAGFKKFIMRGNVMELAVAVIIGSAFTAIVTAFTKGIIEPLLAAVGGSPEIGLGFHIRAGQDATFVDIGSVITAAINFLIVAAVIYFLMIVPMNKLAELNADRKGIDPDEATSASETELLTEIRDLLAAQQKATSAGTAHSADAQAPTTTDTPQKD